MNVSTMNKQGGFTLIELVVVIVILGILAATALPKFIDIGADARGAATSGVSGALASGSVINYSASIAKGQIFGKTIATATATTGISSTTGGCTDAIAGLLVPGVVFQTTTPPANSYKITGATATTKIGDELTCTVTNNDDTTKTATFILHATM